MFTKSENKIRKLWLILLFSSITFEIANSIIHSLERPAKNMMLLGIGLSCAYRLSLYLCGYRKTGTKLLTFSIILFGIGIGIQLMSFAVIAAGFENSFFQAYRDGFRTTNPTALVIGYMIAFSFIYTTFRLRKVNKMALSRNSL